MDLTNNEKINTLKSVFPVFESEKGNKFVKNIGDYIVSNFEKLDGFDFRWSSLISNNPLLFEDINYLKIKPFIDNTITQNEIDAYKSGELRDLYGTFDSLLLCNLKYYDRIISYCTMVFMNYVDIDGEKYSGKQAKLESVPLELSLTPTKIWCAVFSNINSTSWEIKYGWNIKPILPIEGSNKSVFELSYNKLYKLPTFNKFVQWCGFRMESNGYRETFLKENTDNKKLSVVCSKFTKTSIAISENQLDSLFDYINNNIDYLSKKLYFSLDECLSKMFNGDKSQYGIYIFTNEFFIFSSKFSLRVGKDDKGKITKDYLANSYECCLAEEYLIQSIKSQIDWVKHVSESHYEYDKNILQSLLYNMILKDYKNVICIKRTSHDDIDGVVSKISFTGIFNMVKIVEQFMIDNRIIKTTYKTLSKKNAAEYIINRGYYIFGTEKDIHQLVQINKESLITHYNNYCIPILTHMNEAILLNVQNKNDLIDLVVYDSLNPNKFNNENIMYTNLQSSSTILDHKQILSKGLDYQNKKNKNKKKSYWKVIDE